VLYDGTVLPCHGEGVLATSDGNQMFRVERGLGVLPPARLEPSDLVAIVLSDGRFVEKRIAEIPHEEGADAYDIDVVDSRRALTVVGLRVVPRYVAASTADESFDYVSDLVHSQAWGTSEIWGFSFFLAHSDNNGGVYLQICHLKKNWTDLWVFDPSMSLAKAPRTANHNVIAARHLEGRRVEITDLTERLTDLVRKQHSRVQPHSRVMVQLEGKLLACKYLPWLSFATLILRTEDDVRRVTWNPVVARGVDVRVVADYRVGESARNEILK